MVNQAQPKRKTDVSLQRRGAILRRLREAEGPVSGSSLSEGLGLSRVAAWKHLEALREAGYRIRADHRGYRLLSEGDFLHPWEFPGREASVEHWEMTDSTMDRGIALGLAGAKPGCLIVAERQSSGRGRRGRAWNSEPGGLFFSILERPKLPAREVQRAVMAAAATLCSCLRRMTGGDFVTEWPNDILLGGKKIAGVLAEYLATGESLSFIVLGLGLNVRNKAPEGGTSLRELYGDTPARRAILQAFITEYEELSARPDEAAGSWSALSASFGHRLIWEGQVIPASRALAVDASGRLLFDCPRRIAGAERDPDTGLWRIWPGDASLEKKGASQ